MSPRPRDLAIPVLPSRSLQSTLAFYARFGFTGELLAGGTYLILERGPVELHFFPHPALVPADSWAGCYVRVADADAWFPAFDAAGLPREGIPCLTAIEDKPWGMREFALIDEDGNLVKVGHPIGDGG